uniref:Secreted protein n=1 Tax=Steinernema glaseri TaxID=37863 RepID=A0A1I8AVQ9_9BILA
MVAQRTAFPSANEALLRVVIISAVSTFFFDALFFWCELVRADPPAPNAASFRAVLRASFIVPIIWLLEAVSPVQVALPPMMCGSAGAAVFVVNRLSLLWSSYTPTTTPRLPPIRRNPAFST